MVDFNNDSTITRTPKDILEILIIEKRTYFIDAYEKYIKDKTNGVQTPISILKARLNSLFLEIYPSLQKNMDKENFELLKNNVNSKDADALLQAFNDMSEFLYNKKLLMWDSMKQYDPTSAEEENKFHGMG